MSVIRTAAGREQAAELHVLRDQADQSTAEAARTLAELARRASSARRPGETAKRLATDARVTALRAYREGPGRIAGQRGAKRLALAAIPVLGLAVAAYAVAHRKASPQPPASAVLAPFPVARNPPNRTAERR